MSTESVYILDHLFSPHPMKRRNDTIVNLILFEHTLEMTKSQTLDLPDPEGDSEKIATFLKSEKLKVIKTKETPSVYASGFGFLENPQTPSTAHRARSRRGEDEQDILYGYIALDYDTDDIKEADILREFVKKNLADYKIAFYPSISYPYKPRFRLVVELDHLVDEYNYKRFAKALADYIGVNTHDDSNFKTAQCHNLPKYLFPKLSGEAAYFNTENNFFNFEDELGMTVIKPPKDEPKAKGYPKAMTKHHDNDLLESLDHLSPRAEEELKTYDGFWRFAECLAYNVMIQSISQETAEDMLIKVAELAPNKATQAKWEEDNLNELMIQMQKLENDPERIKHVKRLSDYIPLNAVAINTSGAKNLTQLLEYYVGESACDKNHKPVRVVDILTQHFDFGLLGSPDSTDTDSDRLVIFDPLTGFWSRNKNSLNAMISFLRPTSPKNIRDTIIDELAARANRAHKYIQPYNHSQHLVFTDGVWNLRNEELLPLESNEVKDLHFTLRHSLDIKCPFGKDEKPELKIFEDDTRNGGPWSIDNFIDAYTHGGDSKLRTYFLFLLSLGLFGGHNSGVHVNIQGPSGAGKTVLNNIWKGLYGPERVQELTFSDLNTDFPFNDYNPDASLIWVSECNEEVTPLNEFRGVPLYDSLADGTTKIKIKHKNNFILRDAPQMIVEGTRFIQSPDLRSGPARRTLPFKIGDEASKEDGSHYSVDIENRLKDPDNLAWLIVEMVEAYQTIVPDSRRDNFKINLNKGDEDLLPKQAKEWRYELTSADVNIQQFFDDFIKKYVVVYDDIDFENVDHVLSDKFFYKLYERWYKLNNPKDQNTRFMKGAKNFNEDLHAIFEQKGWYMVYFTQKDGNRYRYRIRINSPNRWGMKWGEFDETYNRPTELKNQTHWPDVYGKWQPGYFLTTEQPDKKLFQLRRGDPVWRRKFIK